MAGENPSEVWDGFVQLCTDVRDGNGGIPEDTKLAQVVGQLPMWIGFQGRAIAELASLKKQVDELESRLGR